MSDANPFLPGVVLKPAAQADLRNTLVYLGQNDPQRAARFGKALPKLCQSFAKALLQTLEQLVALPHLGSPRHYDDARLHGLRQWPVTGFKSYLLFYRPFASDNGIEVWRVLHATRDAIPLLQEDAAPE